MAIQFNVAYMYNCTEPIIFAHSPSTIIDLILVSNLRTFELLGEGEPCLMQDIRYHCPTYCVLKFKKYLSKAFPMKVATIMRFVKRCPIMTGKQ